jgi:hypothetical protein
VKDSTTGKVLSGTNILLQSKHAGTVSDKNGKFTLFTNHLPESLKFSQIGYQTKIIHLHPDTSLLYLTVKLVPDTIMLDEAVISGKKHIYNRKSNDYTILDYTILDSTILLLQNKLGLKINKTLVLLDKNYDTLATGTVLPKKSLSLFKDCLGNAHVITPDSAYQVWIKNNDLLLLKPVGLKKFNAVLKDCLFKKEECLFYKKSMTADLGEEIYVFSSKLKQPKLFIKAYDKERYEHYLNDVLHIMGMYHGYEIPAAAVESDSLLMRNIHKFEIEARFLREFVYRPVYNKLFRIHDSLVYFNHINGFIEIYSSDLKLLNSVPVTYQKSKKWKNRVLKDDITNKTYTIYQDAGYYDIYEVNYKKGTINRVDRIPMFETSNIKVNSGYLYYLRKESHLSSTTVKKLYRLELDK